MLVTVMAWEVSAQLTAPFGAAQPLPVILAVPAFTPVMVDPDTDATPELLLLYEPPDQPAGAEAEVVAPLTIVAKAKLTWPAGQLTGGAVTT